MRSINGFLFCVFLCITLTSCKEGSTEAELNSEAEYNAHNEWAPDLDEPIPEDGKETLKYGDRSGVFGEEDSCLIDDCGTLQDDVDQGELELLHEEEGPGGVEDVVGSALCDPEGHCSQELHGDTSGGADVQQDVAAGNVDVPVTAVDEDIDTVDENRLAEEEDKHNDIANILQSETEDEDQEKNSNLDMELENIPLREILLKLKPEGLTDDEEDQSSDYSTTEASLEEPEVEEEMLVSSGSPERAKDGADNSSSSDPSNAGLGGNSASVGTKKAVCSETNITDPIDDVEIINATLLMKLLQGDPNITSRTLAGPCYLVYFFSPFCPFSVMGSPYVNALARHLRNIPVYGLDSIEYHSVNARYGVMGTPTLLLFHNGNGVGRYNASEYSVQQLMSFINHYTDQEIAAINITSADFHANLPSKLAEVRPYFLWAAWVFLLSCASWLFLTSELCARLTEAILNNWREAEAQHDHED